MTLRLVLTLACAALLSACTSVRQDGLQVVSIVGADVVDVERDGPDAVLPERTIVIRGGRIETIGPLATTVVPADALVIDGRGK